jgi:hypothetical protein
VVSAFTCQSDAELFFEKNKNIVSGYIGELFDQTKIYHESGHIGCIHTHTVEESFSIGSLVFALTPPSDASYRNNYGCSNWLSPSVWLRFYDSPIGEYDFHDDYYDMCGFHSRSNSFTDYGWSDKLKSGEWDEIIYDKNRGYFLCNYYSGYLASSTNLPSSPYYYSGVPYYSKWKQYYSR